MKSILVSASFFLVQAVYAADVCSEPSSRDAFEGAMVAARSMLWSPEIWAMGTLTPDSADFCWHAGRATLMASRAVQLLSQEQSNYSSILFSEIVSVNFNHLVRSTKNLTLYCSDQKTDNVDVKNAIRIFNRSADNLLAVLQTKSCYAFFRANQ